MISVIEMLGVVPGTGKFKDHKPTLKYYKDLIMRTYLRNYHDEFISVKEGQVDLAIEVRIKSLALNASPNPSVIIDLVLKSLQDVAFENVKQIKSIYYLKRNVETKKEEGLKVIIKDKYGAYLGL